MNTWRGLFEPSENIYLDTWLFHEPSGHGITSAKSILVLFCARPGANRRSD